LPSEAGSDSFWTKNTSDPSCRTDAMASVPIRLPVHHVTGGVRLESARSKPFNELGESLGNC